MCHAKKKAQQSELNDFLITCRQTPFGHHQRAAQRWPLSCVLCRRERWGPRLFFMFTKKIIMLIWWRERQVVASCDFINFSPIRVTRRRPRGRFQLVDRHFRRPQRPVSLSLDTSYEKKSYKRDIITAHRLWRTVCLSHNPHTKKLSYYNVHPSTSVATLVSISNIYLYLLLFISLPSLCSFHSHRRSPAEDSTSLFFYVFIIQIFFCSHISRPPHNNEREVFHEAADDIWLNAFNNNPQLTQKNREKQSESFTIELTLKTAAAHGIQITQFIVS